MDDCRLGATEYGAGTSARTVARTCLEQYPDATLPVSRKQLQAPCTKCTACVWATSCKYGRAVNTHGCQLCECNPVPTTKPAQIATTAVPLVSCIPTEEEKLLEGAWSSLQDKSGKARALAKCMARECCNTVHDCMIDDSCKKGFTDVVSEVAGSVEPLNLTDPAAYNDIMKKTKIDLNNNYILAGLSCGFEKCKLQFNEFSVACPACTKPCECNGETYVTPPAQYPRGDCGANSSSAVDGKRFCYVDQYASCQDKEPSDYWPKPTAYVSFEACAAPRRTTTTEAPPSTAAPAEDEGDDCDDGCKFFVEILIACLFFLIGSVFQCYKWFKKWGARRRLRTQEKDKEYEKTKREQDRQREQYQRGGVNGMGGMACVSGRSVTETVHRNFVPVVRRGACHVCRKDVLSNQPRTNCKSDNSGGWIYWHDACVTGSESLITRVPVASTAFREGVPRVTIGGTARNISDGTARSTSDEMPRHESSIDSYKKAVRIGPPQSPNSTHSYEYDVQRGAVQQRQRRSDSQQTPRPQSVSCCD